MVQDALRYAGVPDQYNEKVQGYFEYLQARSHPGGEGMQFLSELPSSLHLRLCEFLHSRSLKKVRIGRGGGKERGCRCQSKVNQTQCKRARTRAWPMLGEGGREGVRTSGNC